MQGLPIPQAIVIGNVTCPDGESRQAISTQAVSILDFLKGRTIRVTVDIGGVCVAGSTQWSGGEMTFEPERIEE